MNCVACFRVLTQPFMLGRKLILIVSCQGTGTCSLPIVCLEELKSSELRDSELRDARKESSYSIRRKIILYGRFDPASAKL